MKPKGGKRGKVKWPVKKVGLSRFVKVYPVTFSPFFMHLKCDVHSLSFDWSSRFISFSAAEY